MKVMLHADDFCFNKEISEDILECYREGTLHGISIMPNSTHFDECMKMLDGIDNLEKSIHFSISEGPCVADREKVSTLVDERGMFKLSFIKLLLMSIGKAKKELRKQLKCELKAQYDKALPYLDEINIDSHVHYHMIPMVFDVLLEVIEESGREIGYIRVPAEPITPFLKHMAVKPGYSLINIVKNIILNILYVFNKKRLKPYREKSAVFFGIVMSGHMDIDRVAVLLPEFVKIAQKRGMDLEVLAHPGHAKSKEDLLDPQNEEYSKAPLSENRLVEKNMFMEIHKYL